MKSRSSWIENNHHLHSTLIKYKVESIEITKKFNSYLHSTLIKYKVPEETPFTSYDEIYIPLWLNIKCCRAGRARNGNKIYIPLWLNIKSSKIKEVQKEVIYLHSTLIKYKEFQSLKKTIILKHLHSTLIKYKVNTDYLISGSGKRFTFHSD